MPRKCGTPPGPLARPERRVAEVLADVAGSLGHVEDDALREEGMGELRAEVAAMGLMLHSFEVTHEAMPDPVIDALPSSEIARIDAVSRGMYDDPASLHDELVALVAQHPDIPMLRNHLAGALEARGDHDGAAAMVEETARLFPEYTFGFANYVMGLLSRGEIDRARAIVEEGPRGPLLFIGAFAPSRTVFHATEIVSYGCMTGLYLLATDRLDAAEDVLEMIEDILPEHPHTLILAERLERAGLVVGLREAVERFAAPKRKKKKTKKGK